MAISLTFDDLSCDQANLLTAFFGEIDTPEKAAQVMDEEDEEE